MKKQKQKKAKKNKKNISIQNDTKEVKQVGTFDGFLIFDKIDKIKENELKFQINEFNEPTLKDWLIIQHNPTKTKSRFINLFQEILEDNKKSEDIKKEKNEKTYEENLIPNDIINDTNDVDDDKEIDNLNDKINNININNGINENNNNNIINEEKIIISSNSISNINSNKCSIDIYDSNNIMDFNNNIINTNSNIINPINFEDNIININNNQNNNNNLNIINNNFPNINTNKINNINNPNPNPNPDIININPISNNTIIPNQKNIYQFQNPNNANNMNSYYYPEKKSTFDLRPSTTTINSNSSFPSTAPASMDRKSSLFSHLSNSTNSYYNNIKEKNNIQNIKNTNKIINDNSSTKPSEKKFDLNIDIKRIIYLEDRRTTLMIKNIPNKFNRDFLLKILDQNFKGAYDLFILPTDANRYKNFGYAFINFTSSYYILYFYFLFNNKKWSSTNSKKVCFITYSKIQGRNNLLAHYPNKIVFKNDEAKKQDGDIKYKIPNAYSNVFNSAFPNYNVEKCETYFITKMPFRY